MGKLENRNPKTLRELQICVKELTVDVRWRMDKLRSFVAQAGLVFSYFRAFRPASGVRV